MKGPAHARIGAALFMLSGELCWSPIFTITDYSAVIWRSQVTGLKRTTLPIWCSDAVALNLSRATNRRIAHHVQVCQEANNSFASRSRRSTRQGQQKAKQLQGQDAAATLKVTMRNRRHFKMTNSHQAAKYNPKKSPARM